MAGTSKAAGVAVVVALVAVSVAVGGPVASAGTEGATPPPVGLAATPVEYADPAYGAGAIELPLEEAVDGPVEAADVRIWVDGDRVGDDRGSVQGSVTVHEDDGRRLVVSTSVGDLLPIREVIVRVNGSRGDTDSAVAIDNRTVRVTGATLSLAGGSREFVQGTDVAIVAGGTDAELEFGRGGGEPYRTRGTGAGSKVAVVDTADHPLGTTHWVRSATNNVTYQVGSLGLQGSASTISIDEGGQVRLTAEAAVVGRPVVFKLVNIDGEVTHRATRKLGPDGSAAVTFTVDAPGNYRMAVVDARSERTLGLGRLSVADLPTGNASLDTDLVVDGRGDVLEIPLTFFGEANRGTFVVGSASVNFEVAVEVVDNGDGRATLHWNTFRAANATGGLYVTGAASATFDVREAVAGPVEPGEYPLEARYEGRLTSVATAVVEARSTAGLTVFTVPGAVDTNSTTDPRTVLTPTDAVAIDALTGVDDWVVVRLNASGLEGYVDEAGDLNGTAGLRTVVVENASTVGPNERPVRADVSTFRLFHPGGDVYFLAFRPSVLAGAEPGDRFDVRFTVDATSPVTDDTETAITTFALTRGRVSIDVSGGEVLVPPERRAVVTGTSTFAPGTNLTVQIVGLRVPGNVGRTTTVRVGPNGTWTATFDFSEVRRGMTFEVQVLKRGRVRSIADGRVGKRTASVTFADQRARDAGTLVSIDRATLEAGGFVVVHVGGPDGEVVGVTDYLVGGRTYTDLAVRLRTAVSGETTLVAVAHLDEDGDRVFDGRAREGADGPYRDGGQPVADRATVGVRTPTPTPTPPPASTGTATPTATPTSATPTGAPATPTATAAPGTPTAATATATAGATAGSTPASSPGAGLAAALVALAAAALLAVRRR